MATGCIWFHTHLTCLATTNTSTRYFLDDEPIYTLCLVRFLHYSIAVQAALQSWWQLEDNSTFIFWCIPKNADSSKLFCWWTSSKTSFLLFLQRWTVRDVSSAVSSTACATSTAESEVHSRLLSPPQGYDCRIQPLWSKSSNLCR